MDVDAHGFFKTTTVNREPREIRERILFHSGFAYLAYFAVMKVARLRQKIVATRFGKGGRLKARMKLLLIILTVASGVVCCLLVIVLPVNYRLHLWKSDNKSKRLVPNDYSITIAPHFRLEFYKSGVLFFSNEIPFLNGPTHLADEKSILYKNGHAREVRDLYWHVGDYYGLQETLIGERGAFVETEKHFDLPGIHYRYFDVAHNPPANWTLMVSLWYPISISAICLCSGSTVVSVFGLRNHERKERHFNRPL